MKNLVLVLLFFLFVQTATSQFRYVNSIFDTVETLKDVEYGQAEWLNNKIGLLAEYNIHDGENRTETRPLLMDIFLPRGDTVTKRPVIIFAHSGAFLIGSHRSDDMLAMCDSFARKGYVTTTIDYRMGMGASVSRFLGVPINIKIEYINAYRTAYRAGQDARAAIRFLKHNAENYGIDTTKIFFTGSSAGGILGLYNIYIDKTEEFQSDVFSPPSLGSIDAVGVQGYGARADAVTSMWGAVQNTSVIENENTPVLLIHGTKDPIVPFKKGIPLDSIIPENPILSFTMPETYGSYCVDTALNNQNIFHETYFVEGGIHEFYGTDTGEFPENGPNVYWDTIQNKITHFFFNLFQPNANFEYISNDLAITFINTSTQIKNSLWNFGDGASASGNEVFHRYSEPGVYNIQLTTCNQNYACDTITQTIIAGTPVLAESYLNDRIKIYPNPANQLLHVSGVSQSFNAIIYDFTGRSKIIKESVHGDKIDVSQLQDGIYFIHLKTDNHTFVRKFVKVN